MDGLLAIGVGSDEEAVYRALLEHPGLGLGGLSRGASLPKERVRAALRGLEEKGLASRSASRPPAYFPSPPDIAIDALILRRREELDATRRVGEELADLFARAMPRTERREIVERVSGQAAIMQRVIQLQGLARREVLGLDRPPYVVTPAEHTHTQGVSSPGVRLRFIYDPSGFDVPGRLRHIREHVRAGEEARSWPGVPIKLVIADRAMAVLIPIESASGAQEALVVHPGPLLDALIVLFELLWRDGVPLRFDGEESSGEGTPAHDGEMLSLLAAGLKDEAVARAMGLGVRTVERRVRALMDDLGARTRYQAGLLAGRRGW